MTGYDAKYASRKECMSKTDKTHPTWVKVQQQRNNPEVVERHDHRNGVCDIDEAFGERPFYWQRRGACGYDVSYYGYHGGFYARPAHGRWYRREYYGRERAKWRKTKHEMRKLSREDIEYYDVESRQHRHSALWEMY